MSWKGNAPKRFAGADVSVVVGVSSFQKDLSVYLWFRYSNSLTKNKGTEKNNTRLNNHVISDMHMMCDQLGATLAGLKCRIANHFDSTLTLHKAQPLADSSRFFFTPHLRITAISNTTSRFYSFFNNHNCHGVVFKWSYYLLLHIVQDVFEVQIIVVVLDSFSYTTLKQGRRLEKKWRDAETQRRGGHCYLTWLEARIEV